MQTQPSRQQLAIFTLGAMIVGFIIGNLFFGLISLDFSDVEAGLDPLELSGQRLRIGLFISHFLTFAVPGFVVLYYFFRNRWWDAVNPLAFPGNNLSWVILFTLVAIPLVGVSMWINLKIPLPDWAIQTEDETAALLEKVLNFNGLPDLATALLAVAVAAGVGEELIFRGILQGRVFAEFNHHVAIWLSAAIFSLIHLELAGFLPRMLLGGILGYVFHWSGSLLVPILIHLAFNGLQVIAAYVSGEFTPDTAPVELPDWYIIAISLIGTLAIGYFLETRRVNELPPSPDGY
ncbi:hypothetical protein CEQ90_10775 [Lewinellaceae bacterium SD302]|nr:hypothetical protein CEQ90_10775 [Lewinellaceae bacterium SD302]